MILDQSFMKYEEKRLNYLQKKLPSIKPVILGLKIQQVFQKASWSKLVCKNIEDYYDCFYKKIMDLWLQHDIPNRKKRYYRVNKSY